MFIKSFEFTAIKIFEKYHFSREDAEALVESIKEAKSDENASKIDILRLEAKISKIEERISSTDIDIKTIERDIRALDVKIESVKNQLIIWVFAINFATAGLIISAIKFL